MPDFTDGEVFLDFFGSFWNRFFTEGDLTRGITAGGAHQITQLYQEFTEAIQALSLETINPFHLEKAYPIIFRRSQFSQGPDEVTFGHGQVFGAQPAGTAFREGATFNYGGLEQRSGLYYIGVPDNFKNLGQVIFNGLIDPTVMLARNSDFIFQDDIIVFKTDPFANPLIARRLVAGTDGQADEEEIVLWAMNAQIDRQDLFRQYGFAVSSVRASSDNYKRALQAVFKAYAAGPTAHVLDSLVAALANLPIARRGNETVQSIETFGTDTLLVTDLEVYKVQAGLEVRPEIQTGTVLYAGQPLTTATRVSDRTTNSFWWAELAGLTMGRDFLVADLDSALGFLNEAADVELGDVEVADPGNLGRTATFHLAGLPGDLEKFWGAVRQKSLAGGQFLGDLLYKKHNLVDGNGDPDFTKDLQINPLQFLATELLADGLVLVQVRVTDFNQANPFFQNLRMLRDVMPAYLGLIIFVDLAVDDSYSWQRDSGGVEITTAILQDTKALLAGDTASFDSTTKGYWNNLGSDGELLTKTPEALSSDISPDIISATLDMGDPTKNAAAYGSAVAVCEEVIHIKNEEVCTP